MKPSTAKAKGRDTENRLVAYLKSWGLVHVERRRLMGSSDQGDVSGWPGVCVEVKSAVEWKPLQWLRELDAEADNAAAETGFVACRPKGKLDPEDWVAVIRLPWLMQLMVQAGWIPEDAVTKTLDTMRAESIVQRGIGGSVGLVTSFRGAPITGNSAGWKLP